MKNIVILAALLLCTAQFLPQESAKSASRITIIHSEVNSGVVIITAHQAARSELSPITVELQCNKNIFSCAIPKPGSYQMVQLPKNHGMYDCVNVDLYEGSADLSTGEAVGEYCLSKGQGESAQR